MSILLLRVDERLIHGQVVMGWGTQLRPGQIIVVDDDVAASEWEQDIYCLGVPPEITARFVSVANARAEFAEWQASGQGTFVITRDVATMLRLSRHGLLDGMDVNIGGIHHAPGRVEALPYVYLSPDETAALQALQAEGAHVTARDLPGTRSVDLAHLLSSASAR